MSDFVIVNGELHSTDGLIHYGVLGMKWGVRRATSKLAANERLRKKAAKLDVKSSKLSKKSEKHHAEYDLENANKKMAKAEKLDVKAARARMKIANNKFYVERMQKKVSSISQEDLKGAYAFCEDFKRR